MTQRFEWVVGVDDEAVRAADIAEAYKKRFGSEPLGVARAPGRINLIGEHTDYNGGFVLPLAIDRSMLIAFGKGTAADGQVHVYSVDLDKHATFSPATLEPQPRHNAPVEWSTYVQGVIWAMSQEGMIDPAALHGAQLVMSGNVPFGSGLSSSAALEVAVAFAINALAGKADADTAWRVKTALTCQRAENQYVGANVGIMDQFISALGSVDSALLIDCRSLEFRAIPLRLDAKDIAVVAVNSAVPHSHATGEYNVRRAQCEEAAKIMAEALGRPADSQLRDFKLDNLAACRSLLTDVLYRRAHHVISEDDRTLHAADRLQYGDLDAVGTLLYASHTSMRNDYEITTPEIDMLVELAQQTPGVLGSRMTGGGFGGCTVSLVQRDALDTFAQQVVATYRERTGLPAEMFVCRAVAGGSILSDS